MIAASLTARVPVVTGRVHQLRSTTRTALIARPASKAVVSHSRLHTTLPKANLFDQLLEAMGGSSGAISKEEALPGSANKMKVKNEHFITKNPIQPPFPEGLRTAVFGTGCFWGTEKGFWRIPGVYSTAVGYAAGFTENPTYEQVCSGRTMHNEVVLVVYDPEKVNYADLLRMFWESHDPTQGMGQGNDRGTQYRSGIYYNGDDQKELAELSKVVYQEKIAGSRGEITTEIIPCPEFYYAEDYHQQYLAKPGARPYCSAQPSGIPLGNDWVPEKFPQPTLADNLWAQNGPKPGCTIGFPNAKWA